jgi:hypothetical protein
MENLKSRINRCSQIIGSYENIPQAITIKSTRQYPDKKDNGMTKSIFYDDICDFKLSKNHMVKEGNLNTKPYNQQGVLGKKPDGTLEDVTLTQEILNTIDPFKEAKNDFNLPMFKDLFASKEIPADIERFNSIFSYFDKAKVYGLTFPNTITVEQRDSIILTNFINVKKKTREVKKLQDAPVSITDNVKMTQYKSKRELIKRGTNNKNINVDLPENINLPMISQFDVQTSPLEDYFEEDTIKEIYAPQETIYGDDIYDFQMPLDIIKKYNRKNSKHQDKSDSAQSTPQKKPEANSNISTPSTKPEESVKTNQETKSPSLPLNTVSFKPLTQSSPNIPNVPAVPKVPAVPAVPNIPKVPAVPAVPKVPVVPNVPKVSAIPKPDSSPVQTNPEQPKEQKPLVNQAAKVNLLDEIRSENPMARLKKMGTVSFKSKLLFNLDEKKEDPKPQGDQTSMVYIY